MVEHLALNQGVAGSKPVGPIPYFIPFLIPYFKMNEEKRNKILNLIDKARKEHALIIVEGKKDEAALKKLDLINIFILKKGNLPDAIENIINKKIKKCVILTDFDCEGRKLYMILKRELVKNGIRIDDKLRIILMKEKLSHIEGIDTFLS